MENAATQTWISNTMDFMEHYDIKVSKTTPNLRLQCNGDQFFSDLASNILTSPLQRQRFHMCRLYMQVHQLSNITGRSGKRLLPGIMKGTCNNCHQQETNFLYQACSPSKAWAIWQQVLRQAAKIHPLLPPLGQWFHEDDKIVMC